MNKFAQFFYKYSWVHSDFSCVKSINLRNKIGDKVLTSWLICSGTVGLTEEYRYLPLTTQRTLNVLHFTKKESHRLTAGKYATYKHISNFNQHHLQLKCTLVRGCLLSDSRSIVPVLTTFFIRIFSPLTFHLLWENILFSSFNIHHVNGNCWSEVKSYGHMCTNGMNALTADAYILAVWRQSPLVRPPDVSQELRSSVLPINLLYFLSIHRAQQPRRERPSNVFRQFGRR